MATSAAAVTAEGGADRRPGAAYLLLGIIRVNLPKADQAPELAPPTSAGWSFLRADDRSAGYSGLPGTWIERCARYQARSCSGGA